jgi:predicted kinase
MIIAMAGLPGTGKSTLAAALASHFQGAVLNKDLLRAAAFPAPWTLYTTEQDDFVLDLMLRSAAFLLGRGCPAVILDGRTFSRVYQREIVQRAASSLGKPLHFVECICPDELAISRIQSDRNHPAANRNAELYWRVKANFEPLPPPKIAANTCQDFSNTLTYTIAALASPPHSTL